MEAFVRSNFVMSLIIGFVGVLVGGGLAFKADNKAGYLVLAGGVLFMLYTLRVWGLI